MGFGIYSWLTWELFYTLYEVITLFKNPFDWVEGPFRRGVVGWLIFWIGFGVNNVPILNFITAFPVAWWAVADFYNYEYELF